MSKADFKDIYIEKALSEIKKNVFSTIDLSSKNTLVDSSKAKIEKTDMMMREILKDILACDIDKSNDGIGPFKYNFHLFSDGKNMEEARDELKCNLILYYVALYYDNVPLLQKLLSENVSLGNNPENLLLCALDKELSSLFLEREYVRILKNSSNVILSFYKSIEDVEGVDRDFYLNKFSRILKRRWFSSNVFPSAFRKESLDIYDEDTYHNASLEQLNYIIAGYSEKVSEETMKRLNNLMRTAGFCQSYGSFYDEMFKNFSDEELLNLDSKYSSYFKNVLIRMPEELGRIKKLYDGNPNLMKCGFIMSGIFLDTLNDGEILSLNEEDIEEIQNHHAATIEEKQIFLKKVASKKKKETKVQYVKKFFLPKKDN